MGLLTNNGGDLATTNGGADGGTVTLLLTGSGAAFTINGTGVTHFYNLYYGDSAGTATVGSASRNVTVTNRLIQLSLLMIYLFGRIIMPIGPLMHRYMV